MNYCGCGGPGDLVGPIVPSNEVIINKVADFPDPINTTDLPVTFDGTSNEVRHVYGAGVFADGQAMEFIGDNLPVNVPLCGVVAAGAAKTRQSTVNDLISLVTDQSIRMYIANLDSTTNIVATDANIVARKA